MKRGPVNSYSLKCSLVLHGTLLAMALILPLLPSCRRKDLVIPLDFTVVLDENLVEPEEVPVEPETAPPTASDPEPLPEPPKPVPLPDAPKEAVVVKKVEKPKPPEKKPPEPKPAPKLKPPAKKPFVKGKRVEAPNKAVKPKEDFSKLKPVTAMPSTDKRLTRAEIEKALRDGAKPGTRNVLPDDEISRCVVLVRRAMYEAWEQPGVADAGPRPALLDIRLNSSGRVVSYRIRQSSGSVYFDQTVLKAAANAAPIRGLSVEFLKQFETLTVEFKLE
ncbi:MAG: TonB family protein [Kiritimatiellae bacterium]|nr:TonB family protein [Kiritimatiellia bacterium]